MEPQGKCGLLRRFAPRNDGGSLLMSLTPRFHRLSANDLRRRAPDAVALAFAIPRELADDYNFAPGQYLTLRMMIDRAEVRRFYSIYSGADDCELRISF